MATITHNNESQKAYVVCVGLSPSDWWIDSVFTDKALLEAYLAATFVADYQPGIDEFPLNPLPKAQDD